MDLVVVVKEGSVNVAENHVDILGAGERLAIGGALERRVGGRGKGGVEGSGESRVGERGSHAEGDLRWRSPKGVEARGSKRGEERWEEEREKERKKTSKCRFGLRRNSKIWGCSMTRCEIVWEGQMKSVRPELSLVGWASCSPIRTGARTLARTCRARAT